MKKNMALALALVLATTAQAQVLDVMQGNVTYRYNAKDCGEMTYNDGSSVTIGGRTYALSDVDFISMNSAISVDDNSVSVTYSSSEAQVVIAGNIAQYMTASVTNGTDVASSKRVVPTKSLIHSRVHVPMVRSIRMAT